MSIRITNDKNKRIIIIKNQDDMDNLDNSVGSIDTDPTHWDMFSDEGPDRNNPVDHVVDDESGDGMDHQGTVGDWTSRLMYKPMGTDIDFNSQFNLDTFDDGDAEHYIATTAYPAADEYASYFDKDVINAPINNLKTVTIPDDQTSEPIDDDNDIDNFENDLNAPVGDLNDIDADVDDENPDYQGMIRTVRGAYLVYKRKQQNGTYEEVWAYNVGDNIKQDTAVRKAILAGTDIDPNTHSSDTGEQKASTWTVGNIQFLTISGLVQ